MMDGITERKFEYDKARGNPVDYDNGSLEFSVLKLEISVKRGEKAEGTFTLYAPEGALAEGKIYSSDMKMECLTEEFIGTEEEIAYSFSSEGMEEGHVIEGRFIIISNLGEYELPYRVEVESSVVFSSMGSIKNMFHFANLAKAKWEEAVNVFYSKEFGQIFTGGTDRQYYNAYKGLAAVYGNEQNVEEFLLEINKKKKVEFITEETEIVIEDPAVTAEHSLTILRNGWGYTFLSFETEGEFLSTEKRQITDNDFLGNSFRLPFCVNPEGLHAGRNYGSIRIFNSYMDMKVPVTVICNGERRRSYGIRKEKKRLLVQLMEYYCAYRGKKISTKTWMSETEKLVERLSSLDVKDIQARLFQAQLLITQERYNEAKWQLERIRAEVDLESCNPEIRCYFLYLTTLYGDDDSYVDAVIRQVERAHRIEPDNWRIAWLMVHLSEEYTKSASRRWLILEEQFKRNCTSPILYIEAWHLLELNPTLLMKLGAFEMQVLRFAAKRELLSQDIMVQIRYQIQKLKTYSHHAFSILRECYEKYPDQETLQAICMLLIKGNKTDPAYFEWYSMGVEQELRITKLYEYYMMSLPPDYPGEIPKMILLYFAYQSQLDYRKNAFLYAYVYKMRKEQPEYYIKYCSQIENFVITQIHRGRINRDLAYLYKNVLTPALINEERAKELVPLLFTHLITTDNKEIRQVIVSYGLSREEYRYPVENGTARVPLYGDDHKILLEDGLGNRYAVSVPYQVEKMMLPGKLIPLVAPYVTEHEGMDIYMCESNKAFLDITRENEAGFRHIASSPHMEYDCKNEIALKLLHYYYEQDDSKKLDAYLGELEPEKMHTGDRNEVIRFMVLRGMYDKAFSWLKRYGILGTDIKMLVRLCSRLIARDGLLEDKKLTSVIYHAFIKGKYDGNLLSYLVSFYNGSIRQMREVWKAARAFEVDTYILCERMLLQMMFSGSFIGERMEIFRTYVSGGAKTEVETAFLAQCCYDYFVKDKVIDPYIFTDMLRVYERGELPHKICRLAFLKYYAENQEEITTRIKGAINIFLSDMLEDDIYFGFFKEYTRVLPAMERFADKTIVEYKAQPGSKVIIHYMIERGRYTESHYRQEEMKDMYGGVYVKAFVLFFGEKLQYYITEESEGKEQLTESASLNKSDITQEERDNRFDLINDIVIGQTLQDYDTADSLLEDYYKKEYLTNKLFHLI